MLNLVFVVENHLFISFLENCEFKGNIVLCAMKLKVMILPALMQYFAALNLVLNLFGRKSLAYKILGDANSVAINFFLCRLKNA